MTKQKYIDLTAMGTSQARAQTITCVCAYFCCCAISVCSIATGTILPFAVKDITASTVWIAMILGAVSITSLFGARWIKRAAIIGERHVK